jgi:hypothetical protein
VELLTASWRRMGFLATSTQCGQMCADSGCRMNASACASAAPALRAPATHARMMCASRCHVFPPVRRLHLQQRLTPASTTLLT